MCGIARVRHLGEQSTRLSKWLDKGYDSGLSYMHRNVEKRLDPSLLYEGARSVIVCAANYKNESWDQRLNTNPKISSYALARDYHFTMKDWLKLLLTRLAEEYPGLHGRCFTDSAPLLEKSWAIEAGVGWRGKNSLIVTPHYGSFVFLGEIVTDAEADTYDTPFTADNCGNCTACIDACPNKAIVRPYVIDTSRCISRLTTERLPEGETTSTGTHGWIFGCDICQSVCPHNRRTPFTDNPAFKPFLKPVECGEEFWDKLGEKEFGNLCGTTPMARSGFGNIRMRVSKFFADSVTTDKKGNREAQSRPAPDDSSHQS